LRAEHRRRRAKTFFSCPAHGERFHSLKTSLFDQDSLIFARRIDYSLRCGEINHPILFDWIAGFDGAACAAKKR
jgi:hypothetical protein